MARGWTFGKIVLVIVIALVVLGVGAAWYGWTRHLGPLIQGGRAQRAQGTELGRTADARECLATTFDRYGQGPGIKGAILARLFLDACLSVCSHAEGICEGVPAKKEIVASGRWRATTCAAEGHSDDTCHQVLDPLQEYCDRRAAGGYMEPQDDTEP